ncbi:LasA protease precursor, partial [Candidatus Thiomargarita nelsonii]
MGFDLENYLAPPLKNYAEIISHWSSYFSINPQVIMTLIEMQTGLISDPTNPAVIEQPLGVLSKKQGFSAQVKDVLSRLFSDFYDHLGASGDIADTQKVSAASYALVRLLGDTSDFIIVFGHLFPSTLEQAPKLRDKYTALPPWLMQFPWHIGESWYFNGVHTSSGRHDGTPMSSIDLTPSWKRRWGDDTSLDIVT